MKKILLNGLSRLWSVLEGFVLLALYLYVIVRDGFRKAAEGAVLLLLVGLAEALYYVRRALAAVELIEEEENYAF